MFLRCITLLLFCLTACRHKKATVPPATPLADSTAWQPIPPCKNWEGQWRCYSGDSLFTDSLVIQYQKIVYCLYEGIPVGPQGQTQVTRYKSNKPWLDSVLWHYCPYKNPWDDDIHITCAGKNYIFRYDH